MLRKRKEHLEEGLWEKLSLSLGIDNSVWDKQCEYRLIEHCSTIIEWYLFSSTDLCPKYLEHFVIVGNFPHTIQYEGSTNTFSTDINGTFM